MIFNDFSLLVILITLIGGIRYVEVRLKTWVVDLAHIPQGVGKLKWQWAGCVCRKRRVFYSGNRSGIKWDSTVGIRISEGRSFNEGLRLLNSSPKSVCVSTYPTLGAKIFLINFRFIFFYFQADSIIF